MAANQANLSFRDRLGKAAKVVLYVAAAVTDPSSATVQAIRNAIVAILDALNYKASISITAAFADTVAGGAYSTCEDKVLMVFKDVNGKRHSYKIPGPDPAIFQLDAETVDPTNPAVATFTAAWIANVKTQAGDALDSFVYGRRIMTKPQRQ